jgi:hypothetical protein
MGLESVLGIIASLVTTLTGIGFVIDRNGKRIDQRFATIISHMEKMEQAIDQVRMELPLKYTLREDYLRLAGKVEDIQKDILLWKHTETSS